MRVHNKDLKRACRWLAAGKNKKVIRFLEPKVPLFLEDPNYYAILGRACHENGLLKDADTYLNRGLQADPYHLNIRLNLAVNHLKKKDPSSAVCTWLEVLDDYPDDRNATRGLKLLKKITDQEILNQFLTRLKSNKFLPHIRPMWPGRILSILIVLLPLLIGVYFRSELWSFSQSLSVPETTRPGGEHLTQLGKDLTQEESDVLNPMRTADVSRTLKRALKLFERYDDNSARYELNKIRYSNATEDIHRKVNLVMEALAESNIETLETSFTFKEVNSAPWLYENCWILWRGVTANVEFRDKSIHFEFLVGYEDGAVLEGRVPVTVPFLAVMEPLPLELLARVEFVNGSFRLVAKTLYFLR